MGFKRAPSRVALRKPTKPTYRSQSGTKVVDVSIRPTARPNRAPAAEVLLALREGVDSALQEAQEETTLAEATTDGAAEALAEVVAEELLVTRREPPRTSIYTEIRPTPRPVRYAALETDLNGDPVQEVVTRMSSSGGRHWGVNIGHYTTQYEAERVLLQTALSELDSLDSALRKVVKNSRGWSANFVGMTLQEADLACRKLESQGSLCQRIGPPS